MARRLNLSAAEKAVVYAKYDCRCAYCGRRAKNVMNMYVDHVQRFEEKDGVILAGNLLPACPMCLKAKDTLTIEGFRASIGALKEQLNRNDTYRLARVYGLVVEIKAPVEFYFERQERIKRMEALSCDEVNDDAGN